MLATEGRPVLGDEGEDPYRHFPPPSFPRVSTDPTSSILADSRPFSRNRVTVWLLGSPDSARLGSARFASTCLALPSSPSSYAFLYRSTKGRRTKPSIVHNDRSGGELSVVWTMRVASTIFSQFSQKTRASKTRWRKMWMIAKSFLPPFSYVERTRVYLD